jgi:hypothetical protein
VEKRVSGLEPKTLHHHQDNPQPDAQRRVDIMECGRESELDAGQDFDGHTSLGNLISRGSVKIQNSNGAPIVGLARLMKI